MDCYCFQYCSQEKLLYAFIFGTKVKLCYVKIWTIMSKPKRKYNKKIGVIFEDVLTATTTLKKKNL